MTWVSYAQNYEDVTLMRALHGVREGFYVDVGAHDPRADSVTRAFYERGWRGINVEPVPHWHALLAADRERDVNLCVAAGDQEGTLALFEVDGTGLSTTDERLAARYREEGLAVRRTEVSTRTLDDICREHGVGELHFLKIDAEGAEAAVLRGIDLGCLRPWIIVVEATQPRSQRSSHDEWEALVTGRGYRFAWFDGLNRFYVAKEHAALQEAVARPPCVFDDFIRYREQRLVDDVHYLRRLLDEERESGANAGRQLRQILDSRSWRVTAPLRWLGRLMREALGRLRKAKSAGSVAAAQAVTEVADSHARASHRTPMPEASITTAAAASGTQGPPRAPEAASSGTTGVPTEATPLPAHVRRVGAWLADASPRHGRG